MKIEKYTCEICGKEIKEYEEAYNVVINYFPNPMRAYEFEADGCADVDVVIDCFCLSCLDKVKNKMKEHE